MTKILGFDASSTTIGWSVLEIDEKTKDIKFIDCGFLKPIKEGSILERLYDTRDRVAKLINDLSPDYIGIEDIISYIRNRSTANTVITLAVFNRMIGLLSYDFLSKPPELFNVLSIRHALKLTKVFPKKEQMPELVARHLNIKFPYRQNKKGKNIVENEDMADSIAVALYYAFVLTKRVKVKNYLPKLEKKSKRRTTKKRKTRSKK